MKQQMILEAIRRQGLRWVVFAGVANFLIFVMVAIYLGGNALGGESGAGRYFVSEHGRLTEVSRAAYLYSQWHARTFY
jgi:thiosulfate reductase cytochrome b subunit